MTEATVDKHIMVLEGKAIACHPVVDLPIDKIIPTSDNPRKIGAGDPKTKELVESITAAGGVLVPVIVRRHPKKPGMYDLRDGERRLIAAKIAGLTTIKAEIMELDDRTAREITAVANLQREDLTPLEESAGVKLLLDAAANPGDIEHVAATLGRPVAWVHRRARLVSLTDKWRKALAIMPTDREWKGAFGRWGAGHMELIACHEPEVQDQLFADLKETRDAAEWMVGELREFLGEKFLLIKKAAWNATDGTLYPKAGACVNCPKRTSQTPHLFDDMDDGKTDAGDRCLDPACWAEKRRRNVDRKVIELKKDHKDLVFVTTKYTYGQEEDRLKKRFPGYRSMHHYNESKKGAPGAIPALVVHGDEAGTVKWVRPPGVGPRSPQLNRKKGADGGMTMAEKRKRLDGRRAAHAIDALKTKVREYEPVDSAISDVTMLLILLTAFGTNEKQSYRENEAWKDTGDLNDATLREDGGKDIIRAAWVQLRPIFEQRLSVNGTADALAAIPEAKKIAGLLRINFEALSLAAVEAIPEPKSWAAAKPEKKAKAVKKGTAKPKAKKPVKGVCRVCGCTHNNPCPEGCAWTDETETLCTVCAAAEKQTAAQNAVAANKKGKKTKKGTEPVAKKRKGKRTR
jgi:ParB/RepB/Spo0J family partition protein